MTTQRKIVTTATIGTFIYIAVLLLEGCNPAADKKEPKTQPAGPPAFVGASACLSCHTRQFDDWKKSDHFRAMQEPRDSTVLGDFNNAVFTADGVTNRFFRKEGKYYINTQGDDGKNHDYEVLYTFGHFPLQQYLVAFPGGRMQATRASWDSRKKKWFHQNPGQKLYHKDWLHWTGNGQNWNTMCASCHSTNLQKNYDLTKDAFNTTWTDINVACESCHGPASRHVSFVSSEEYRNGERIRNSGLAYAHDTIPASQINTCAPCHARKTDLSQELSRSGEILQDMIPQVISNEFYYADGQINEEDYEYGSFTQSKMFHNNVRCSNCHNPHSGTLLKTGNDLCMSCHKPRYNTKEHHFHTVNTEGAQCISCHMPAKTFMGNDIRRDHSFRVPRPDQSVVYETPNTCTNCHKGKSAAWAADAIKKRYGPARAYHFSDDLLPGSEMTEKSEKPLLRLLRDTLQPEIARATAAYYLRNVQTQLTFDALIKSLQDKKALVRYHALRSLESYPAPMWDQKAVQSLTDRARAVRIAAADLYHRIPPDKIPAAARTAFDAADGENRRFLRNQTDFAVGNVMLADYHMQAGDQVNAIVYYVRGLKKDSLMNYARLNLSAAYNGIGKNAEALSTLKEAGTIDPQNDRVFYNIGLLLYELKDISSAAENFKKAVRLGSDNPGLYYNYGLLLQQQGKLKDAEQILLKGFAIDPRAININYALTYFYLNQNSPEKAKKHAIILKQMDPGNPEYQPVFRSLGI